MDKESPMKDPRQLGMETVSAVPREVVEGVQRDLERDPALRAKIVKALTEANFGFGIAILTESQSTETQELTPAEAYRRGAYGVIGALLRTGEIADLDTWFGMETVSAPEDAQLAVATADDGLRVGGEAGPPAA